MKRLLLLMFFALSALSVFAQRTVSGRVTDQNGEPLVGASVIVANSASGAVTDLDGKYTVKVPNDNAILRIAYTGFNPVEIAVGSQSSIDISMQDNLILQEAVVTAFGIKKNKENLGYAVTEISNKDLTTGHVTNVTNALVGKIPGVRLQGSGGSFSGSNILIRGYTTFTGSNQPLMVVDGIPIDNGGGGNALQTGVTNSNRAIDLNQEDIESISVLKGAAATVLYGSRAAAGVILVTTRQGKAGLKNSISYTTSYAVQEVNRTPNYQNTYGQGVGGNFNPTAISSWGPRIAGQKVPLPSDYDGFINPGKADSVAMAAYPDNVTDLFRKGPQMQHNISFQGSKNTTGYRLSLGYLDDQGVLDNNRLKRYNIALNATSAITDRLTAGVSANYILNTSVRSQQGNQLSNPLFRSWFTPRSWNLTGLPYQTATGSQLHYDPAVDNPRWTLANNLYDDHIDRILGNFNLSYQLLSWLRADYKVGVDYYGFNYSAYDQIGARGGASTSANGAGGIREWREINRNINSYLTLGGNRNVGRKVEFQYVLGQETIREFNNQSSLIGRGLTVRDFRNLNANTTTYVPFYSTSNRRIIGVFGTLTTIYNNWATAELMVRNDWNSTLPKANNSYLYYSAAGTINVTEAVPALKSKFLSLLKLRGNYGLVGRSSLLYATDSYYSTANPSDGFGPNIQFPFNGLQGFTLQNTAGNPNLEPEFTRSWEGGVDLSVWKDFLSFEATYYETKSTGIILSVPNSPASGVTNVVRNAGSLKTKGYEVGLTLTPIKTKSGAWSSTFNFTKFTSTVEELATGVQNIFLGGFTTPNIRLVAGDAYGQIYGNAYQRNADGKLLLGANGLPLVTPNVQKIGNPNPDWVLGINNNISFKGFALGVLLDIRKGGDIYSRNVADLQRNGTVAETAEFDRFNSDGTLAKPYKFEGVFASGPNAGKENAGAEEVKVTAEQYWGNSGKYVAAEGYIYDVSWFRVREASLSYTVPKRWLDKSPCGALEIGIFGRNLFLRAPNYPHLDPEQNVLGINNAQGLEFNALPQTRSFGVNLRLTL